MFVDNHHTIINLGDWVAYNEEGIGFGEGEVTGFDDVDAKVIIDGNYKVKSNSCYNLQYL